MRLSVDGVGRVWDLSSIMAVKTSLRHLLRYGTVLNQTVEMLHDPFRDADRTTRVYRKATFSENPVTDYHLTFCSLLIFFFLDLFQHADVD
jgi:hypothetical protein